MLIQGLRRLLPNLPRVCQLWEQLPWIIFTTLQHNASSSKINLQLHFANKAKFLFFNSSKPRPPFSWCFETNSHFTKWLILLPLTTSQKKFLIIFSISEFTVIGIAKEDIVDWALLHHLYTLLELFLEVFLNVRIKTFRRKY